MEIERCQIISRAPNATVTPPMHDDTEGGIGGGVDILEGYR